MGLSRAGLQAQVSDFRMAPRCVAASLVTKAFVGRETYLAQVLTNGLGLNRYAVGGGAAVVSA